MQCVSPVRITKNLDRKKYPDGLLVPCGKCIACRVHKRNEWSLRIWHELDEWNNQGIFITLTYNDENIPANNTLVKEDLQKFFKRLRKSISPQKIKYFACGEYGDKFDRPHYHAIIIGLSVKEQKHIINNWHYGFVKVGIAEPDSINYVCKYINKKYSGELAKKEFTDKNRIPVFRLLSQGLGKEHALKNKDQYLKSGITQKGVKKSYPRYYLKKYEINAEDLLTEHAMKNDIEFVHKITGKKLTTNEFYKTCTDQEILILERARYKHYRQMEKNLEKKIEMKDLKRKT